QEIYLAGDHLRVEVTGKQGNTVTVYDGASGWVEDAKGTHALSADELEQVRGAATWAVDLTRQDGRMETYFFEQDSGLLVMRRSILPSAFGKFPAETWFMDYRELGGVRLPMTIISASLNSGLVRRYDEVQVNLPIDP